MGDRLWLYATYHCNLRCSYCLTESGPRIRDRRELGGDEMLRAVREAAPLGLRRAGVTGGEVFMLPDMPAVLAEMAAVVPTTALTNATLFTDRLLGLMEPLAGSDGFSLQVSLDSAEADHNDRLRGPRNFARVCDAVPALRERGIRVRLATTVVTFQSVPVQLAFVALLVLLVVGVAVLGRSVATRQRAQTRALELQAWQVRQIVPAPRT